MLKDKGNIDWKGYNMIAFIRLFKVCKEKPPSGEFSPEHRDMQQKSKTKNISV